MKKILLLILVLLIVLIIGLFFLPIPNSTTDNSTGNNSDNIVCFDLYDPVCGQDGQTYSNSCEAAKADIIISHKGECKKNEILFKNLNTEDGLFCIISKENDFVINSQEEYAKLTEYLSDHENCQNFSLPKIDFSDRTLLGKYASSRGCKVDFARTITKDEVNRKYIYEIKILAEGSCQQSVSSMNWVTVPKISQNYSLEFKIK